VVLLVRVGLPVDVGGRVGLEDNVPKPEYDNDAVREVVACELAVVEAPADGDRVAVAVRDARAEWVAEPEGVSDVVADADREPEADRVSVRVAVLERVSESERVAVGVTADSVAFEL